MQIDVIENSKFAEYQSFNHETTLFKNRQSRHRIPSIERRVDSKLRNYKLNSERIVAAKNIDASTEYYGKIRIIKKSLDWSGP